jgi:hypothetical protein
VLLRRSMSRGSAIEPHLPLVESREQHRSVVDRPDAGVDLLEADELTAQSLAGEDAAVLPAHHSVVLDLVVSASSVRWPLRGGYTSCVAGNNIRRPPPRSYQSYIFCVLRVPEGTSDP